MELTVPQGQRPMPLSRYLPLALREWPPWAVRQALRARQVKRNGERLQPESTVFPGDRLTVYLPAKAQPKQAKIPILYEDKHVIVAEKPVGLSVREGDAAGGSLEEVLRRQTGVATLRACHRLDIHTGGVLLLAKTEEAWHSIKEAFEQGSVHKAYVCRAVGTPQPAEADLEAYLRKDARAARVEIRQAPFPGAKPIRTRYQVLSAGEIARLRVEIPTGRTHQIRAHLAYLGHPILGDDKYGNREVNHRFHVFRQQLWAAELRLDWPLLPAIDGRTFTSDPPF